MNLCRVVRQAFTLRKVFLIAPAAGIRPNQSREKGPKKENSVENVDNGAKIRKIEGFGNQWAIFSLIQGCIQLWGKLVLKALPVLKLLF